MAATESLYASKIIKAGALLSDTKILLAHWDGPRIDQDNLDRVRHENVFGKASRSRIEDILRIFRQRYLGDEHVTRALVRLVDGGFSTEAIDRILYFHAALSDRLFRDTVIEFLFPRQERGRNEINIDDLQKTLTQWVSEGKTSSDWSDYTTRRVAQGLLATLRDFGVLEGAVKKTIAPAYLPTPAFAYIAYYLKDRQSSGKQLLEDANWRLFFFQRMPSSGSSSKLISMGFWNITPLGQSSGSNSPLSRWNSTLMLSLKERLELLENDLTASPPSFVMNADLPFAVFRYDPFHPDEAEWRMRREIQHLKVRVTNATNRQVRVLPMSKLFWQSIDESEGLDELIALEREQGFAAAQEQVTTYLSDEDFRCLPDLLVEYTADMDADGEFLFLTRTDVFAAAAYRISSLMEQMKGKMSIPTVLFYPGSWSGSLNYMGLRTEEEPLGSYRLKIYGRE